MKFLSSLPDNSLLLSQKELKSYCQVFYRNHNFTKEEKLDSEDQRTFREILERIKYAKHGQMILELTNIMPPGILHKIAGLGIEIYTIENKNKGNWGESPAFSFYSIYTAFFLIIPPK